MQLSGITIAGQEGCKDIRIEDGLIGSVTAAGMPLREKPAGLQLVFKDAIAFPGLINSHDHLDFNLFPQLGEGVYNSYKEWGADIHLRHKETISSVLRIPLHLRNRWGIYKNLLNGITTVIHHGAPQQVEQDLITVGQEADSFHSVSGEKNWRLKLLNPFKIKKPVVIHVGEGIGVDAAAEINELLRWNMLHRPLIGIHGIAMDAQQAESFRGLVWCPGANYFLFGKTAAIGRLKYKTQILFGTDSTVSASWNIWEQLRLARSLQMATDDELYDMVTGVPAYLWPVSNCGSLYPGGNADLVVAQPPAGTEDWDAFYALNPENILLVMHKGHIRLFDQSLYPQLMREFPLHGFYKISIGGTVKYVQGDLPGLVQEIRRYHPAAYFPVSPAG